jgi:hypothetical protein
LTGLDPREHLWIRLEHVDEEEKREMKFKASGKRYDELLDVLRHAVYGAD